MQKAKLLFIGFLSVMAILMLESTTCNEEDPEPNPVPTVTTSPITSIATTTATGGGTVTTDGELPVTERGVCWNTSANPTISDNNTSDGSGMGPFTSEITGLTENTTYNVRAYAANSSGVGYGQTETFTTTGSSGLPIVTTSEVSDITNESAVCGGNILSDGGADWVSGGVCWNTSPNPLKTDNSSIDINNEGSFTSTMNYLAADTKYYVRAYAVNSNGTSYGDERSFTTKGSGDEVCDYETSVYYSGQSYEIDAIGDQCWMIEDLNYDELSGKSWCYDDNSNNCVTYGRLYNWEAIMGNAVSSNAVPSGVQGICPPGWHLPSDAEWSILLSELQWSGGFGFPGLSGGSRNPDGTYSGINNFSYWWSCTEYENDNTQVWYTFKYSDGFMGGSETVSKDHGFSVRCIKD